MCGNRYFAALHMDFQCSLITRHLPVCLISSHAQTTSTTMSRRTRQWLVDLPRSSSPEHATTGSRSIMSLRIKSCRSCSTVSKKGRCITVPWRRRGRPGGEEAGEKEGGGRVSRRQKRRDALSGRVSAMQILVVLSCKDPSSSSNMCAGLRQVVPGLRLSGSK